MVASHVSHLKCLTPSSNHGSALAPLNTIRITSFGLWPIMTWSRRSACRACQGSLGHATRRCCSCSRNPSSLRLSMNSSSCSAGSLSVPATLGSARERAPASRTPHAGVRCGHTPTRVRCQTARRRGQWSEASPPAGAGQGPPQQRFTTHPTRGSGVATIRGQFKPIGANHPTQPNAARLGLFLHCSSSGASST